MAADVTRLGNEHNQTRLETFTAGNSISSQQQVCDCLFIVLWKSFSTGNSKIRYSQFGGYVTVIDKILQNTIIWVDLSPPSL